jgi:branched-chain amino acid transport system ATP-binding protein
MLRIRNLQSGYGSLRILKGVSLHVNPGEIVTIVGGNGAGKSTLLNTIAGTVAPRGGAVEFRDEDIAGERPERIVRRGCSLVPEGRQLFPTLTVRENLMLGAYTMVRRGDRRKVLDELEAVWHLFPVLRERGEQYAGTLSGGEQQMVAIGRSLMAQPDLIMMDEPSMGLAPLVVRDILTVVVRLKEQGKTILLVEQNARAALAIADRGYVMETGSLVIEGSARELLSNRDVQRAYLGKEYRSIGE